MWFKKKIKEYTIFTRRKEACITKCNSYPFYPMTGTFKSRKLAESFLKREKHMRPSDIEFDYYIIKTK